MNLSAVIRISLAFAIFTRVDAVVDIAAAVSAAAAAVSAGTSLAGTTITALMNTGYKVNCGIEVENWTKFPLTYPIVRLKAGALSTPPHSVLPSKREAMVARKTSDTATGSYGTVSWLVEGLQRRMVIMWSAPYDFNLYSNWLGVGITKSAYAPLSRHHWPTWFNQMYYKSPNALLGFRREKYRWDFTPVIFKDDKIEVIGTMGSSHQAKVKITVRPVNVTDLADPIKNLLVKK